MPVTMLQRIKKGYGLIENLQHNITRVGVAN